MRHNVREPVQVVRDIYSLAGCNEVGARRLLRMMDEFAIASLESLSRHILEQSRTATLDAIRALPNGTWSPSMRVDGHDEPLDLVATLRISDVSLVADFAGTSPPSR